MYIFSPVVFGFSGNPSSGHARTAIVVFLDSPANKKLRGSSGISSSFIIRNAKL